MAAAVARVVQTWTNGIPYSELEVDKAVTARAALYPDLDKWYLST